MTVELYKWVRRDGDRLLSLFAGGDLCVEYKVGEYVEAPIKGKDENCHLLSFSSLDNAVAFKERNIRNIWISAWELYSCSCDTEDIIELNFKPKDLLYITRGELVKQNLKPIYYLPKYTSATNYASTSSATSDYIYEEWPEGTVMTKQLKLTAFVRHGQLHI